MTTIDHIGIYVKDLNKSTQFYNKIFNFPEKMRIEVGDAKIIALKINGGLLELIKRPGSPGKPPEGNWTHIALELEDYTKILKRIKEMDLELRERTVEDGSRIAFFKDPDGHTLEVMEKGLGK